MEKLLNLLKSGHVNGFLIRLEEERFREDSDIDHKKLILTSLKHGRYLQARRLLTLYKMETIYLSQTILHWDLPRFRFLLAVIEMKHWVQSGVAKSEMIVLRHRGNAQLNNRGSFYYWSDPESLHLLKIYHQLNLLQLHNLGRLLPDCVEYSGDNFPELVRYILTNSEVDLWRFYYYYTGSGLSLRFIIANATRVDEHIYRRALITQQIADELGLPY